MSPTPRHSHERAFAYPSLIAFAVAGALVVAGLTWLPGPVRPWLLGAYLAACPVAAVIWYRRLSHARERDVRVAAPAHSPTPRLVREDPGQPFAEYTSAVES